MTWRWGVVAAGALAAGCSTDLLHGVDERTANEATSALERAGIGAEKRSDETTPGTGSGYAVRVARGDGNRAVDLLRALGLPRERRRGFTETYGQPSLIPTPSEERARFLDALAGEIERTLESADGVVGARVHLVLEEEDTIAPGGKPRTAARASVLLRAHPGRAALPETDVQRLVAGSVAGLEPGSVAVVIVAAADPADALPAPLAAVGPLRITPGTRSALVAALAVALGLLAVLAGLLLVTARRLLAAERLARPAVSPIPSASADRDSAVAIRT